MSKLSDWLKQPSSITGLGLFASTLIGVGTKLLTHDTTAAVSAGMVAGAVVHLALPDNTAMLAVVERDATDLATALATKQLQAMAPKLLSDAMATLGALAMAPAASAGVSGVAIVAGTAAAAPAVKAAAADAATALQVAAAAAPAGASLAAAVPVAPLT
jgi:hypothetical protein